MYPKICSRSSSGCLTLVVIVVITVVVLGLYNFIVSIVKHQEFVFRLAFCDNISTRIYYRTQSWIHSFSYHFIGLCGLSVVIIIFPVTIL